jgi:hypothetical protein
MLPNTSIHYGSVIRWIVATLVLAASGLNYLYIKHQFHVIGTRRIALEHELDSLMMRSRDLDWQISALTSQSAVQNRLKVSMLKLKEVPENAVVSLRLFSPAGQLGSVLYSNEAEHTGDQLQTVSHERLPSKIDR